MIYILVLSGAYAAYQSLPDPHQSGLGGDPLPVSRIVANDGSALMTDRPFLHQPVALEEISPWLQTAVLTALHSESDGASSTVDPARVFQASLQNSKPPLSLRLIQAQAKHTSRPAFWNRIQQALQAIRLENDLGQESLLELYLNQAYFGEGAYGAEAASQLYFAKRAEDLNAGEAALLAGLMADPEHDNPYFDPDRAIHRRDAILLAMKKHGDLPSETLVRTISTPIALNYAGRVLSNPNKAPWFNRMALSQALTILNVDAETFWKRGYKVETTLDPDAQRVAESWLDRFSGDSAAVISLDEKNGIMAYSSNQLALPETEDPLQIQRSAHSLIRPVVYASALQNGADLRTRYDNLTLPQALIKDNPQLDALVLQKSGTDNFIREGRTLGLDLQTSPDSRLSMNNVQASLHTISAAYNTFRNNGIYAEPYAIRQITDRNGKVVYRHRPVVQKVLSRKARDTMVAMMRGALLEEKPNAADWPWTFAGFGGQSVTSVQNEQKQEAWFVGFTPTVTTGIMVAHASPEQSLAHWQSLMTDMLSGRVAAFDLAYALPVSPKDFQLPIETHARLTLKAQRIRGYGRREGSWESENRVAQGMMAMPLEYTEEVGEAPGDWKPPASQPVKLPESKWGKVKRWAKKSWRRIKDEFN